MSRACECCGSVIRECPECQGAAIYKGTYASQYGYRYRRFVCTAGHKWREDMQGGVIEVRRGRLPLQSEVTLLRLA